jgi:hypothetical protein
MTSKSQCVVVNSFQVLVLSPVVVMHLYHVHHVAASLFYEQVHLSIHVEHDLFHIMFVYMLYASIISMAL